MRIRTQCRACGFPLRAELPLGGGSITCDNCRRPLEVAAEGWTEGTVEVCPLCDSAHFYRQRDFNRALGCTLVAVGAILVPWTYGLSLIVLSLLDLWLYYRLPEAVVCYRCDTVFRDARPQGRQGEFDLLKHDVVKYGKSWQDIPKSTEVD